jgi:hypothetical protein
VVGSMWADGGDGVGALDATPTRVLCSSERKAKEVEEVGDDGWALSGGVCVKMVMSLHPCRDVRQGHGPSIGLAGWATSHGAATSM